MVDQSDVELVEIVEDETGTERYRTRFREPTQFEELVETPQWAQEAAETISDGARVRMGRVPDGDALQVESVSVPRTPTLGEEEARRIAEQIVEEIQA